MKQEHQTNKETETNSSNADAVLSNGLAMRQRFCDLINHFFGLNVSVSLSDSTTEEKEEVAPQGSQTKQIEGDEQ